MKKQSKNSATQTKVLGIESQPVSQVQWINRDKLKPNHYNPNKVAPPEMELLKISIMEDGWTQPIVINPDFSIVDGFHRYTVSGSPEVNKMTDGKVPCVIVKFDKTHKMMSTIRHNRARGTHAVLPMAEIIREMIEKDKMNSQEIMSRLQMEDEEVIRLANRSGLPTKHIKQSFGKSFLPDA